MEDTLISFDTAELAKEKGFKPKSFNDYWLKGFLFTGFNASKLSIPIVTQSLLQKWLREVHKIYIDPYSCDGGTKHNYNIMISNSDVCEPKFHADSKSTYEEALEAGLQAALKLISHE